MLLKRDTKLIRDKFREFLLLADVLIMLYLNNVN